MESNKGSPFAQKSPIFRLKKNLPLNDELGGTRKPRRQSRANDELGGANKSVRPLQGQDELGGTRNPRRQSRSNHELGGIRKPARNLRGDDELGGTTEKPWKLRDSTKLTKGGDDLDDNGSSASTGSTKSSYSNGSIASANSACHPVSQVRAVSRVPSGRDLGAPPTTYRRASFEKQQERKKNPDDFVSLNSVHSRTAHSALNSADGWSTDSDDDSSFDGDSFASVDSDAEEEDDDAYREARNQLARLEIEDQRESYDIKMGKPRSQRTLTGVHGTTLGLIAE